MLIFKEKICFAQIILCRCSKIPDFAQIFPIAARKILVLRKYFLVTVPKILILPRFLRLEVGKIFPLPSGRYGYVGKCRDVFFQGHNRMARVGLERRFLKFHAVLRLYPVRYRQSSRLSGFLSKKFGDSWFKLNNLLLTRSIAIRICPQVAVTKSTQPTIYSSC